ncbi:hypothetical protein D3C78_1374510 [compost metagenome]
MRFAGVGKQVRRPAQAQAAHLLEQRAGVTRIGQQPLLQLFHLPSQQVVSPLQQLGAARSHNQAAIDQAFVDRFQFMGQIADGPHPGHPRAPLEGVQVALQRRQRRARLRRG